MHDGIDSFLARARAGLARVTPAEALARQRAGALLVDTRPVAQRAADGEIPGSIIIERNVLEWRLDPRSDAAIPEASGDREVIVVCNEGYASSLAAATLREIGVTRATDLEGGFRRWRDDGLPISVGPTPAGDHVPA